MHPVVHPGVAYLLYAGWRRATDADPPGAYATLALVVGALLPDLVDQPLYHVFFDLPSTRTFAHSLLVAFPVVVVVAVAVGRSSLPNEVGSGFAVGYLSHPAADALWPLLFGPREELGFLLWPVTHSPPYEGTKTLFAVGNATVTTTHTEVLLLAAAVVLWWRDGKPGVGPLVDRLRE